MPHQSFELYQKLLKEVEDGNVNCKVDGLYSLFEYSFELMKSNKWNEWNRHARGIIFDNSQSVVCRPFKKFFNILQFPDLAYDKLPNSDFILTEKLDGSCLSTYLRGEELYGATPGSMVSSQSLWGIEWLKNHLGTLLKEFIDLNKESTCIFETIFDDKDSKHVVKYDKEECVLLAIIDHNGREWHPNRVDLIAKKFNFNRPRRFLYKLGADIPFEPGKEGYVAFWPSESLRVKIKDPEYVRLHKIVGNISEKGLCEVLCESRFDTFTEMLPAHFRKEADDIYAALRNKYDEIKNKCDDVYFVIKGMKTRKEQALFIQKALADNKEWHTICYQMLDGIDTNGLKRLIWHVIYKSL